MRSLIVSILIFAAEVFGVHAQTNAPLMIPRGINLLATNAQQCGGVMVTNLSTNTITVRSFDCTLSAFRVVQLPTGPAGGPLSSIKYQATVAPCMPPLTLGPWGGTNCVGFIPSIAVNTGFVVMTSGDLYTDYIPTNALPTNSLPY